MVEAFDHIMEAIDQAAFSGRCTAVHQKLSASAGMLYFVKIETFDVRLSMAYQWQDGTFAGQFRPLEGPWVNFTAHHGKTGSIASMLEGVRTYLGEK